MNKYIYHILFLLFFIFTSCGLDEKDIKNPLEERQIQEQIKSAEHELKQLIHYVQKQQMDSIWYTAQLHENHIYYIFDGHDMVFWSDHRLILRNMRTHEYDQWFAHDFVNARTVCKWTQCDGLDILAVIPYQWKTAKDATWKDSFSFKPVIEQSEQLQWWKQARVKVHAYFVIILTLFVVLCVYGLIGIIRNHGFRNMKLRLKFQYLVMILMTFGFIYIFTVSVNYVRTRYEASQKTLLEDKTEYIQQALKGMFYWDYSFNPNNTVSLNMDLHSMAELYNVDIQVYNKKGFLVGSSTPQLFERELLSKYISSIVFFSRQHSLTTYEQVGRLRYLVSYNPLYNGHGIHIGFIAVPLFISEGEMAREVDDYLARLLPPYLVVLIIGFIISFLISHGIVSPLSVLSDKMKNFQLGKRDNHITYWFNDEIGDLVYRYNEMVDELERSTKLLARSEREGAWKTLARQIAHEINNPLTPMKLTIQQLQRMKKESGDVMDTEKYNAYFDRATNMLIEQIENLSRIATSFSTFIKMPDVNLSRVDIAEKLSSVISLFQANEKNVSVRYIGPDSGIIAYADREQIQQVFTNIIKNAIQALEEKEGGDIIVMIRNANNMQPLIGDDDIQDMPIEALDYLEISFSDNGPGIPLDIQHKVFMPNFTTKSTGSGLGLAISKNIVEASFGKICFQTSEKGTTFFVYLRKKE